MSSVCHIMKSGWITANAPLRNGVGRFMPQLARITIKFCKVGILCPCPLVPYLCMLFQTHFLNIFVCDTMYCRVTGPATGCDNLYSRTWSSSPSRTPAPWSTSSPGVTGGPLVRFRFYVRAEVIFKRSSNLYCRLDLGVC